MLEPLTLADAVLAVRAALGDASAVAREVVLAARTESGVVDADIPPYLPHAVVAVLGSTTMPTPIAAAERGYAWLLADIAPLIPSAIVIDEADHDGIGVPALGRALVITRGSGESWQVVAFPRVGG